MKEEINLLKPEQARPGRFSKKSFVSLYIVLTLFVAEAILWGWFLYSGNVIDQEVQAAQTRIGELDSEINQNQPLLKEAINYQTRLANLETLLNGHLFWSEVLKELGEFTYKNVYFDSFIGDAVTNVITVSGTATSYTDIAKLILGFKQSEFFTNVIFRSEGAASGEVTGFSFSLEITTNPLLLKK